MFVKAISVVGIVFLLENIGASNCPRCGGKVRSRSIFEEDVPDPGKFFNPSIVQPKTADKPPLILPLQRSSFQGPCFRKTAIVKPAIIPRPVYIQQDCTTGIGTNGSEIANAAAAAAQMLNELTSSNYLTLTQAPVNLGPAIDVTKAYQQALAVANPSIPADAVSQALAYKTYQDSLNKRVQEDVLTYGFRKLPVEKAKPVQPGTSPVSEASLYSLNGQVVELKPAPEQSSADSLSAEALDELADLACGTETNANFAQGPSLVDLGYIPATTDKATFIDLLPISASCPITPETSESLDESVKPIEELPPPETPPSLPAAPEQTLQPQDAPSSFPESPADLLPPPLTLDGFKPGDVIYEDLTPSKLKEETVDCGCESQEEVVTRIPVLAPPCGCKLNDLLNGIRTYIQSRARGSCGCSMSSHKRNDKKRTG